MVRAVPGVPGPARAPPRRPARPARGATRAYARFLLDGQTAVLDDYLEVRPEAEARLRRARRRRAACRSARGWSSWTSSWCRARRIVRDLQLGIARATRARRRDAASATSPTCSGTSRRCRRSCASPGSSTRWCGAACPPRSTSTAFWWQAPDGSRVRAEYLYGSYSNGRDLPDDAEQLVARAARLRARARAGRAARRRHAADERHRPPAAAAVARATSSRRRTTMQDDYRFAVTSLARVPRRAADRRACPRGAASCVPARAPTCSWASRRTGSTCTRRAAAAERALERRAEPLSALFLPADRVPARAARRRLAQPGAEQRARLVVRVQPRRGRRRGARALPGGPPHRRGARPRGAAPRWPTRSTPRRRRPWS